MCQTVLSERFKSFWLIFEGLGLLLAPYVRGRDKEKLLPGRILKFYIS